MPMWSNEDWRARIGSCWCALGRSFNTRFTRCRGKSQRDPLSTHQAATMVIMMILFIAANMGLYVTRERHKNLICGVFFGESITELHLIRFGLLLSFLIPVLKFVVQMVSGQLSTKIKMSLKRFFIDLNDSLWFIGSVIQTFIVSPALFVVNFFTGKVGILLGKITNYLVKLTHFGDHLSNRTLMKSLVIVIIVATQVFVSVMVALAIIYFLLLTSGDVEQNPGPEQTDREVNVYKIVKSGPITDPDRLFNDLSIMISGKYLELGLELGLAGKVLTNVLETGKFKMVQGNKKALKMLHLWRDSVRQDECTYSVLAAALEKLGFLRFAHEYCYITAIPTVSLSSMPELRQLHHIEVNGKRVEVIYRSAATWKRVALRLYLDSEQIELISRDNSFDCVKACEAVFAAWQDGRGRMPVTWRTLIEALEEAELLVLATELSDLFSSFQRSGQQTHEQSPELGCKQELPTLSSTPLLHELDLIEGNGKRVRVLAQSAPVWQIVATFLNLESHEIHCIEMDCHYQSFEACRLVFVAWQRGRGRMPITWGTVIEALQEAELLELATNLEDILSTSQRQQSQEQSSEPFGKCDLQESNIETYICVARSQLGFVYLPYTIPLTNVDIQSIYADTLYPKTSANEVLLTPVVSITSQGQTLTVNEPAVIELIKTAKLHAIEDKTIVPIFSNTDDSIPPNWEDLQEKCEVLDDRIRFKTPHFSYFAVIARFLPPTASVNIDPENDSEAKLTVPELPGFNVVIPPKSVSSPIKAKATLYYDETDVCKRSTNQQLASAYVRLEPDGQQFSEEVSVHLPIPGYSEIIAANPDAKLQLMYCHTGSSNDWEIHDNMKIVEVEGEIVAQFFTDHFSDWQLIWSEGVHGVTKAIGSIFMRVKSFRGRCQVFMSSETEIESVLNFSIQVLVYRFQNRPHQIPCNYHYTLYDSCSALDFTPGMLHFSLNLKEHLYPVNDKNRQFKKQCRLSEDSPVQAHFDIDLDKKSKSQLVEGAVFAHLSVKDSVNEHEWNLIKPLQREESMVLSSSNDWYSKYMFYMIVVPVMVVILAVVCYYFLPVAMTQPLLGYSRPTLPLLEEFKVIQSIGTSYLDFGFRILNDEKGDITYNFEHECRSNPTCIVQKVCKCWLDGGEGIAEATWDALVNVLCGIGKKVLAEDLIKKLSFHSVDVAISSCP